MKIWVFSLCRNEVGILPFYLRHYSQFADKIVVWDDASTDGSRELLKSNPKVEMRDWPHPNSGINEDLFLKFAYDNYPMACGKSEWSMWVDCDELIYAPNLVEILASIHPGHTIVRPDGWNMVGDGLPKDDGRQIWEIMQNGVRAPVYSKPVIFRSCAKVRWNRGKHDVEGFQAHHVPEIKLLHYRYLGYEYTKAKNANNYGRCGLANGDRGAAWSCAPDWKGAHSAEWAEAQKYLAEKIL